MNAAAEKIESIALCIRENLNDVAGEGRDMCLARASRRIRANDGFTADSEQIVAGIALAKRRGWCTADEAESL